MPRLLLALAFVALAIAPAASALATYANARFGYTIEYPADLLAPEPEAENGDGREFDAKKGKAKILVYGGYNALDESPSALAHRAEDDCTGHHAQYRVAKPGLVAVSCMTGEGIFYQKTLIRGDTLTTLRATYPAGERGQWDAVVAAMARSMAAPPGE